VEEIEDIVIKEVTVSGEGESVGVTEGAIFTGAGLTPEDEISPEGEVVLGEEEGKALEEEAETSEKAEVLGTEDKKFPWIWLFLAVLIGGFVGMQLGKKTKNDQPFN